MSASDIIYIAVSFAAIAMILFGVYYCTDAVFDKIKTLTLFSGNPTATAVFDATTGFLNKLDYGLLMLFLGLALALIVSGYLVGGEPIFMIIYIFIVVLGVMFSMIMSNIWEEFTTAAAFGTTISAFPITNHLLTHFPYYTAVIGIIGIIVMYAKPYFSSGEIR